MPPDQNLNPEQKGNDEAKSLVIAFLTITCVAGAFWILAWMILDWFQA